MTMIFNQANPHGAKSLAVMPRTPEAAAMVANIIAANARTESARNATVLPKDVWGDWDRESVQIERSILAVFSDLAASVSVPFPVAKSLHYAQLVSDSGSALVSMDGRATAPGDQQTYKYAGTPVPMITSAFQYGWRQMEAARSEGFALDSDGRANATRRVAEQLEAAALDGYSDITVNGQASYGLRTHPKRSTRTTGVALNGATGAQWVAEVVATLKLLHAKNHRAPATLYVNWDDWFYAANTEFTSGYPKTIAQRVLESGGIASVVPSNSVTAGQIIAVVKQTQVVRVLNAMAISTVPKTRIDQFDPYVFMTMAATAVEIKYDDKDQCGVAVSTL